MTGTEKRKTFACYPYSMERAIIEFLKTKECKDLASERKTTGEKHEYWLALIEESKNEVPKLESFLQRRGTRSNTGTGFLEFAREYRGIERKKGRKEQAWEDWDYQVGRDSKCRRRRRESSSIRKRSFDGYWKMTAVVIRFDDLSKKESALVYDYLDFRRSGEDRELQRRGKELGLDLARPLRLDDLSEKQAALVYDYLAFCGKRRELRQRGKEVGLKLE